MRRFSANTSEVGAAHPVWPTVEEVASSHSVPAGIQAEVPADVYKKAYLEGFDAGHADGDQAARSALADAERDARSMAETARDAIQGWRERLCSLTEHFEQTEAKLRVEMEALAVEIAFAAACRLVGDLHAKRELIAAFCQEAVADLHLEPTQLRVSPSDHAALAEMCPAMPSVPDPAMRAGDCLIVTALGEVETGIETRLHAVLRALLGAMRRDEVAP